MCGEGVILGQVCRCSQCTFYTDPFILNLLVEFVLFVTQYSRIMFINSGKSENSNNR